MYYIQEADKPNKVLKIFNVIKVREDKIILPICGEERITEKQAEKLAKKTKQILSKSNCQKVVLSKKIKKQEQYQNYLNSNSIQIIEGKQLFKMIFYQTIHYLIEKKKMKKEEVQISITVNEVTEEILENIRKIVIEYKKVNIVTNHIEKFKNIEERIAEEEGIMLTISNNKRKSLVTSQIILNIDFPTEVLNRYRIYEEAIIINLQGNVKINKKRFNGIMIQDYEIQYEKKNYYYEDYELVDKYAQKDVYEAQIYFKQPIQNIEKKLKQDKVKITKLMGINNTI